MNQLFKCICLLIAGSFAATLFSQNSEQWNPEKARKYKAQFITPENPLGIPEYDQLLTIHFSTPEEAKKAKTAFTDMPDQQTLAFSTRWDDSNPKHVRMAELLQKHQMKGTFYLTRITPDFAEKTGKKILEAGSTVGAHTLTHPHVPKLLPNQMFFECMMIRPELEAMLNTNVIAFVLPGCQFGSKLEPGTEMLVGSVIQRSGYLATPEFWNDTEKRCKLPEGTCFSTNLFSADDRNPTEQKFTQGFKKQLERAAKAKLPHVTFGIHTWQDDKGFALLDRMFSQHGEIPEFWYCTENDHAAYQYQFRHTKLIPEKNDGKVLTFRVRRISPHRLGSEIPVSLQIRPRPQSVTLNGTAILRSESGVYKLPHDPDRKTAELVELIRNDGNNPLNNTSFDSKKFPGLSAGIHWDDRTGQFHGFIQNNTRFKITNLHKTFYFPMKWKKNPPPMFTWDLMPGERDSFVYKPQESDLDPRPETQEGNLPFVAQFDFLLNGKPIRIYATALKREHSELKACPRDTAVFLGPVKDEKLSEEKLIDFSEPGAVLRNLGETRLLQWQKAFRNPVYRSYVVFPYSQQKEWLADARKAGNGTRLITFDFEAISPRVYKLFCDERDIHSVYLNGIRLTSFKNGTPLKTIEGTNRILVVQKTGPRAWFMRDLSISVAEKNPLESARCFQPVIPKYKNKDSK